MPVQVGRHVSFDGVEEFVELSAAMAAMQFPNDLTGFRVESREQSGGAVTQIIMAPAFGLARTHGQNRRGTLQGLDLALFIDAQYQSVVGWIQIKPNNVAHFVDEQRIPAQLEGFAAMGLQGKRTPDATDGGLVQPRRLGHGSRRPMSRVGRLALQSAGDDGFDFGIGDLAGWPGRGSSRSPWTPRAEKRSAGAAIYFEAVCSSTLI